MRDSSSRSSTNRTIWCTWRSITSSTGPGSSMPRCRMPTQLRIGASGLRNSCARVARNSVLRWSASCSPASRSRNSYWRPRPRRAERTAVTSAATRIGRSSTVRLAPSAMASASAAESAPWRARIMIGRSDQGGWRDTACSSSWMCGSASDSSASRRAPAPRSSSCSMRAMLAQGSASIPARPSSRAVIRSSRAVAPRTSTRRGEWPGSGNFMSPPGRQRPRTLPPGWVPHPAGPAHR